MQKKKAGTESCLALVILFLFSNRGLTEAQEWEKLSYKEKNHQLFLKQKESLEMFLERGAISKEQYERSLHDLKEKMDI